MPGVHYTKRYKRIRVRNPNEFDPRSFRTEDVGRQGRHKIVIGCPKGKWDSKKPKGKQCSVGTKVQVVLEER